MPNVTTARPRAISQSAVLNILLCWPACDGAVWFAMVNGSTNFMTPPVITSIQIAASSAHPGKDTTPSRADGVRRSDFAEMRIGRRLRNARSTQIVISHCSKLRQNGVACALIARIRIAGPGQSGSRNRQEQEYIRSTANKMRFNFLVNLFLHILDSAENCRLIRANRCGFEA